MHKRSLLKKNRVQLITHKLLKKQQKVAKNFRKKVWGHCISGIPGGRIGEPKSDEEMNTFMNILREFIDPKLEWKDVVETKIMKDKNLALFYKNHVKANHYCFQGRKCLDPACTFMEKLECPLSTRKRSNGY